MMEDFEKIQKREGDRRRLVGELQTAFYDAEEAMVERASEEAQKQIQRLKSAFYLVFAARFSAYLLFEGEKGFDYFKFDNGSGVYTVLGVQAVTEVVMSKINAFTTVEAEKFAIIGELIEFLAHEIQKPAMQKMFELSLPPGRDWFLAEIEQK